MQKKRKQQLSNIPKHINEEEFLRVLNKITKNLSMKFRFGYFTSQDIAQEAFIILTERKNGKPSILDQYNGKHPLENFLSFCLKNRLKNFKRDKYQRIYELKCKCDLCKKKSDHEVRLGCSHYKKWYNSNLSKKNIILPIGIDQINDQKEKNTKFVLNIDDQIDNEEVFKKIDMALPVSMRADYIKMKNGGKICKLRAKEILEKLRSIVYGTD